MLMLILLVAGCGTSGVTTLTKKPVATATLNVPTASTPFPNAAQIDAYLTGLEQKGVLSGSVLVAHDGMLFEKGYGLADKDANIPNTPQTRFRIGSNTKQFTAMAILLYRNVANCMCRTTSASMFPTARRIGSL